MELNKKKDLVGDMIRDLEQIKRVPKINYLKTKFLCCSRDLRKHKRLLEKSETKIKKELDL